MNTIEENIIENVLNTLQKIGSIRHVERDRINPLELQRFPAALLIDVGATPEQVATSVTRLEMSLSVELWHAVETGSAKMLSEMAGIVHREIMKDPHRGGYADNTIFEGKDVLYAVGGESLRGIQLKYLIQFRHRTTDPFARD